MGNEKFIEESKKVVREYAIEHRVEDKVNNNKDTEE